MTTPPSPARDRLADLSLPVRLVLTVFLIAVGLGYLSALVQLRVQHATAGRAMPGRDDVRRTFHGEDGTSKLERLLTAPMDLPRDGSGSMQFAMMQPSLWKPDINRALHDNRDDRKQDPSVKELTRPAASELVGRRHEGELKALVEWARLLSKDEDRAQKTYTADAYRPSDDLAAELHLDDQEPVITKRFLGTDTAGKTVINIKSILDARCVRCHRAGSAEAGEFPLDTFADLRDYSAIEKSGGMSLPKLAQTTHVHLLGFAVLWCITGLLMASTGFPTWVRVIVSPLVLVAQIADIACWWLAGMDVVFADAILVTGGIVGAGLALQMVLTFWDLYCGAGRVMLFVVLLLIGLGTAEMYRKVVEPKFSRGPEATTNNVDSSASK